MPFLRQPIGLTNVAQERSCDIVVSAEFRALSHYEQAYLEAEYRAIEKKDRLEVDAGMIL